MSKGKPCHFEHPNTSNTPRTPTHTPTRSYTPHSNTQEKSRSLSPITRITPTHSSSGFPNTGGVGGSGGVIGGVCGKCGHSHGGVCLWSKRCFVCGGVHAAKVCPKQQNKFEFGRGGGDRRKSV
jgi:hypothetical protein